MSTTRFFNALGTGIVTGLAYVGGEELLIRSIEAAIGECFLLHRGRLPHVVFDVITASVFGIVSGVHAYAGNKGFFCKNPNLEEEPTILTTEDTLINNYRAVY